MLKKDGGTLTAGPEAVQDLSAPLTQGAPVYTDSRQKHVTVPGVSVNDVVEYDVVTTVKPVLPGHFWNIWTFTDKFIALQEQLDLNVPNSVMLKIKNPAGIEPSVSDEGDRRIYHWATSNLKKQAPVDLFKNFEFDVVKLLGGSRSAPTHPANAIARPSLNESHVKLRPFLCAHCVCLLNGVPFQKRGHDPIRNGAKLNRESLQWPSPIPVPTL